MSLSTELRRRSRQVALPIFGACVLLYFSYHTIQGERGVLSYMRLGNEVERARDTLDRLRYERNKVERRVSRLRDDSMDLDLLEERARVVLNRVREDEIVLFLPSAE